MEGIEIRSTADKGRSIYAAKDFKADDIILEEVPFVSSQFAWSITYKYLTCEYCMRPLESAEQNASRLCNVPVTLPFPEISIEKKWNVKIVKCPHCDTKYCSDECFGEAIKRYHLILCLGNRHNDETHPLNVLIEEWKKIHYPPETTTIMLIVKLLAMYKQSEDKTKLMNCLKEFQDRVTNEDFSIPHKMIGPNYQMQLKKLYPFFCAAFNDNDYSAFLTPESFQTFFSIIGTNSQGIGTSAFGTWVNNVLKIDLSPDENAAVSSLINDVYAKIDEVTGHDFMNNEGSALYIIQSKFNHSCKPNAQVTYPYANNKIVVRALCDIKATDEIFISYLEECLLNSSRHSRQKELKENYMFLCKCVKCEEQINDPDVTSDEEEENDEDDEDDGSNCNKMDED